METSSIRHTELPGATKLFLDYLYHFERVAPLYAGNPAVADSFARAARGLHFPESRRSAIVAALREQNGESAQLETLARAGSVAVVTGQQVGLFTGPSYSVYKALTAVKLARQLSARGIPAVPVFWMAAEDHDAEEINHCWCFDREQRPLRLAADTSDSRQAPVGALRLKKPPLNELRAALSGLPFGDEIAALAEASYADGRTFAEAFRDLMTRLLGTHAMLFLDPLRPAVRSLAAPLLREAVAAGPDLVQALLAHAKELEKSGYHAQVQVMPSNTPFFLLRDGRRIPVRWRGGAYIAEEERISPEELAGQAERISPNALLRPVVQDFVLPTAAFVGGPAEIAYFAQCGVLYRALLGRMPVAVPRAGFTVLDARAGKLMRRYGLTLPSFFEGLEALEGRIARCLVPSDIASSFVAGAGAIDRELGRLRETLEAFDKTLAAALDRGRIRILHQVSKLERKAAREALRRNERAGGDARYLFHLVYPHRHLQERFYSILPLAARHGLDFVDRVYKNVHLDSPDHVILAA